MTRPHEIPQRVRVLAEDLDLAPGNRVLLHSPNTPMMAPTAESAYPRAFHMATRTASAIPQEERAMISWKAASTVAMISNILSIAT